MDGRITEKYGWPGRVLAEIGFDPCEGGRSVLTER